MLGSRLSTWELFSLLAVLQTFPSSHVSPWDWSLQPITVFYHWTDQLIWIPVCFSFAPSITFFVKFKVNYCNSNAYYPLLLLLSGDTSLNPGPSHNLQKCVKSDCIWSYSGPYSVQMRTNTDQNNSEYRHFLRIVSS